MAISADWIAQNTATTGTGTITLGTALTGFIRLQDDSRITDGALVNYTIEDGNNREMGIGTYASAGGTLARTVVQRTLVSGTYDDTSPTAISLSGSAVVRCSPVANDRNFRGCLVGKTTTQTIANSTTVIVTFDTEIYDTDGFHDNVTNNSRITIPTNSGISKVQLIANSRLSLPAASADNSLKIRKNGTSIPGFPGSGFPVYASGIMLTNVVSPVISVVAGDYFEFSIFQISGSSATEASGTTDQSWFFLKVIE